MFELIKQFLGIGPDVDFAELVRKGAIILDVRSKREYLSGHITGSINIPVDVLSSNLGKFKHKDVPIITCCASGARSASAKQILRSNGFKEVYNGGGWSSLEVKLT
jgi:phage shock protein E